MKKIITSALVASMVLSMATIAHAEEASVIMVDETSKLFKEENDMLYEVTGDITLEPGDSLFVEILPEVEGETINSSVAGKFKVVTDWDNGDDAFADAEIVNKKVTLNSGAYALKSGEVASHGLANSYNTLAELQAAIDAVLDITEEEKATALAQYAASTATSYKYLAEIETKASFTTEASDLIGEVKVVKKSSSSASDASVKMVAAVVGYEAVTLSDDVHEVENNAPVINFDESEEVELLFGSNSSFTVDASNQDDLFLGFTEVPNTAIIDQNLDANIDFISFDATPSFNRLGTMRIFADEDMFVYEVAENGALSEVETTYDEDYGAYAFKTRTLTSYAISDIELDFETSEDDATEEDNDTTVTPEVETEKPNPGTGR